MAVMIGAGSMATAYLLMMKPEKRHQMAKKARALLSKKSPKKCKTREVISLVFLLENSYN